MFIKFQVIYKWAYVGYVLSDCAGFTHQIGLGPRLSSSVFAQRVWGNHHHKSHRRLDSNPSSFYDMFRPQPFEMPRKFKIFQELKLMIQGVFTGLSHLVPAVEFLGVKIQDFPREMIHKW